MQSTTDYTIFRKISGNREVNKVHVQNLADSIKKKDLLKFNPLLVTNDYKIIDGQHRLEAAKKLNKAVYFNIIDPATIEDVQLLNSNSKQWRLVDYMESYIALYKPGYEFVKSFLQNSDLPITTCLVLLSKNTRLSEINRDFKTGKFVVDNLAEAHEMVLIINKLRESINPSIAKSRHLIYAIRHLYRSGEIDIDRLVRKMSASADKIGRLENMTEYLRLLEAIYNHGLRTKVRFF